jgi:hypothetical protein
MRILTSHNNVSMPNNILCRWKTAAEQNEIHFLTRGSAFPGAISNGVTTNFKPSSLIHW